MFRSSYENPTRPTFLEPYESIYSYRNSEHIAEGFSGTGNLATLPSVVAEIGSFAGIEVAEDRDWGLRACAAGYADTVCTGNDRVSSRSEDLRRADRGNGTGTSLMTTSASGPDALVRSVGSAGRSQLPDLQLLNLQKPALLAPCLRSAGAHLGISLV